ncbi:MAG: VWA domain-containing protein [Ignavibacteriae bacterium]|nr:VWA domain-containing protein [Ignavibacteriota bacterium]
MRSTSSILWIVLVAVLLGPFSAAQPVLNFKRVVNNWPTIELYYAVSCNGNPVYLQDTSKFRVYENGALVNSIVQTCPDLNVPSRISVSLVFDASGSMMGSGNLGAIDAGHAFIDSLDGVTDQAAILWFNSVVTTALPMTISTTALHTAMESLPASGATAVWDGIYAGVQHVITYGTNPVKVVIAMTDGGDNSSSRGPSEAISLANRNGVRIFTIGLGSGIQTAILQNIADLTGGRYYETPSGTQLAAIYKEIFTILRQNLQECKITYQAQCMDGAMRKVDLQVVDICGGTDTKTKSYKAPKDTSTFTPLNIALDSVATFGTRNVVVPLRVETAIPSPTVLYPATWTITFDTCAEFFDIKTPPGCLLEGIPITITPAPGGVTLQTMDSKILSGIPASAKLAEITFKAADPPTMDSLHCQLQLTRWTFEAGCYRPVLRHGSMTIAPREPRPVCATEPLPAFQWDTKTEQYLPKPITLVGAIENVGDRDVLNTRFTFEFDSRDMALENPTTVTQDATPRDIPPSSVSRAQWDVVPRPRLTSDSVTICFTASFSNYGNVRCCRKLWIPKSIPLVRHAAPAVFCAGDSLLLQAVRGYTNYRWSTGEQALSIMVKTPGYYWYQATDAYGSVEQSDTVRVFVRPPVQPEVQPSGPVILCNGATVRLTTSTPYTKYDWSTGEKTRSITVSKGGTYSVHVEDGNGCTGSSAFVEVIPQTGSGPVVTLSGPDTVCALSAYTYTINRFTGTHRVWNVTGGQIKRGQGTDSVDVRWEPNTTGRLLVSVTDTNTGCAVHDTLHVAILQGPSPRIQASGAPAFCQGDSVVLDAGAGYTSYLWSDASTSRYCTVRQQGNHYVTVNDGRCSGTSDTMTITVFPNPPIPVITRSGDRLSTTVGPYQYEWARNTQTLPAASTHEYTAIQTGQYTVTVRDSNGCSSTSAPYDVTVLGIDAAPTVADMDVYPDPSRGEFTILLDVDGAEPVHIVVTDVLGRVLMTTTAEVAPGRNTIPVRLHNASPGLYFLGLSTRVSTIQRRITVQ